MEVQDEHTGQKAFAINSDDSIYGTFAEIGAGQEVARHFFQVGRASHTIAKTISAYDMTFSDAIYGKDTRYVCESRVQKMLDHEYELLVERLKDSRGPSTRFFAFANTIATGSRSQGETRSHGWLGLRYQLHPLGPVNDIIMHVRLWDQFRLQQQEALGRLGVNMIYGAYNHMKSAEEFINHILDNIGPQRVEVDLLRFSGDSLNFIDNRLSSLELVRKGLTESILFDSKGQVQLLGDMVYGQPCLVLRGTFRPITTTNLEILEKGRDQFIRDGVDKNKLQVLCEMTMHSLLADGKIDKQDFLDRVDTLCSLGYCVLVSNFFLFYQLKNFLRTCTSEKVALVVGASHLEKLFEESYYSHLKGGILEAFSRLFDKNTSLLVFPYKTDELCLTASTFHLASPMEPLFQYFYKNGMVRDIENCDSLNTSVHSLNVREMLEKKNPKWETLVPESVRELIKSKKLFGYKD